MWYDVGISDSHSPLSRLIIFLWSLPLQRAYQAAPTSECACRFPSPRKACQASVNPLVQRLVVRILTVAPKKLPIDYGGTAPSLYPAGGKRSTPPSVDYGGTAPALYPAGDNYGTPPSVDYGGTAPRLNPIDSNHGTPPSVDYAGTASTLYPTGGIRAAPPSLDYGGTAPALYPTGGNCRIPPSTPQATGQRKLWLLAGGDTLYEIRDYSTLLIAIIARVSSCSPTNERACRFPSTSPGSLSSCQATRLANHRAYSQAIAHAHLPVDIGGTTPALYRTGGKPRHPTVDPSGQWPEETYLSRLVARKNTFYEIRGLHGFCCIKYFPPLATTTFSGHWSEVSMAGCRCYR